MGESESIEKGESEPGVSAVDREREAVISVEDGAGIEGEARADLADGSDVESGLAPVGLTCGRTNVTPSLLVGGLRAIRSSAEGPSSNGFRNGSKVVDAEVGGKRNAGADGDDSSSGDASGVAVEPEVVRLR